MLMLLPKAVSGLVNSYTRNKNYTESLADWCLAGHTINLKLLRKSGSCLTTPANSSKEMPFPIGSISVAMR